MHAITFIGAGNMASSLIGGLIADGYDPAAIWATNPTTAKLEALSDRLGINTAQDNAKGAQRAEILVLAVKPQTLPEVARELADVIAAQKPLLITIAAGVPTTSLESWLGNRYAIVRAMPNTPALVGCGATALFANGIVDDPQREIAENILRAVGQTLWVEHESLMDVVTALSGSGPAYFFLVMEALQAAAVDLGLSSKHANLLTLQTALGAARMAIESENDAATLREQVTSPGGTTEAALTVLESGKLRDLFKQALTAAKERGQEIADMLE